MRLSGSPARPLVRPFRVLSATMIGGVLVFGLVAAFVARGRPAQVQPGFAWLLASAGVAVLALSWVFDGATDPRRLVAQALRETTGLIGAVVTLLTGEPGWVAGLGAVAVVALAAGMARGAADSLRSPCS